jgi:general secretion pathway protein G
VLLSILVTMEFTRPAHRFPTGFTLIELLFVVAIIGVLSSIAVPAIHQAINQARVAKAIADIRTLSGEIAALDSLPVSLAAIGRNAYTDPWGTPYVYTKIQGTNGNGGFRKDRFLVPLNSDYDLYSMGEDRNSQAPLVVKVSHDDIIRANDGGFIGLASRY